MTKDRDPIGPTEQDFENEQRKNTVDQILYHTSRGILRKIEPSKREHVTPTMLALVEEADLLIKRHGGVNRVTDLSLLMELGMDSEDLQTPYYTATAQLEKFGISKSSSPQLVANLIRKYTEMKALKISTINEYENRHAASRNAGDFKPGGQRHAFTRKGAD